MTEPPGRGIVRAMGISENQSSSDAELEPTQGEKADVAGVGHLALTDFGSDLHRLRGDLRMLEQALRNDWGGKGQQIDTAKFAEQLAMEAAAQKLIQEGMTEEQKKGAPYKYGDRVRMAGLRVAVQLRAQKIRLLELLIRREEIRAGLGDKAPTNVMQLVVQIEEAKRGENVLTPERIKEAIARAAAEAAADPADPAEPPADPLADSPTAEPPADPTA